MASARARSTRPICAFHASGYSLAHSSTNRTSLSLYSMTHANTERPTRRGLAPRRMASARSRSTHPICAFHASGHSLAHSPANRTSLSLYSMTHANTERLSRRAGLAPRCMASARSRSTHPKCALSMRPDIRWLIRLRTEHHFHFIL